MLGVDAGERTAVNTETQGDSREEGTGVHGAQNTWAGVFTGTATDARILRKVTVWVCRGRGHMSAGR